MRSSTGRAAVAAGLFLAVGAAIANNFAVSYYLWFVSLPLLLWLTFLVFHSVRRGRPDRLSFLGVVLAAGVVIGTIVTIQVFGTRTRRSLGTRSSWRWSRTPGPVLGRPVRCVVEPGG